MYMTSHKLTSVRNSPGYIRAAVESRNKHYFKICTPTISGEFLKDLVYWVYIIIAI